ncbi:MAG: hypothetical protein Q9184_006834 [Pyrenodesmia sp. 2 TL-2023]
MGLRGWVPDADLGAALGVLVGVRGSAHDGHGEGDNVVVGARVPPAGPKDRFALDVVGQLTLVREDAADDKEKKGG